MTSARPTLVWFRDDLRVADHPALHAAVERGRPVVAVYVLDEIGPGRAPGVPRGGGCTTRCWRTVPSWRPSASRSCCCGVRQPR